MELNNWFSNTIRYIYAFINICSLCHTLIWMLIIC